ncbi:MAG: nitroreductase family protein [Sideroxydans sp.]|nr:nitroreductase family protein [Sideroxydans sp.]
MSDPRAARVMAYHARSKHALDRYAAGPGTLDWEAQPAAFRDWTGCTQMALPRDVLASDIAWGELGAARAPLPFDTNTLGSFFRLSLGLTAWKEYGSARWSLRAHPSSGNLHPTESWLITSQVPGIADGLHHYQNLHHALERRAWNDDASAPGVWLGFSSIHWREAWKYGERAFRYCQLDMGHVLAAVSYAAALHGWQPRLLSLDANEVAQALGVDRAEDFANVEAEEAEVIVALHTDENAHATTWQHYAGAPSLLDPRPLYQWPVIEEVAAATRGISPFDCHSGAGRNPAHTNNPCEARTNSTASSIDPLDSGLRRNDGEDIRAAQVILKRRSAQAFDGESVMPHDLFKRMLASLLAGGSPVWNLWSHTPRVHPVLLVHRVEGVAPGVYVLPRAESAIGPLRNAMRDSFTWQRADDELPLYQLIAARAGKTARTLSCHQDIASHCAVTFMMVAEFAAPIAADPAAYRHLHWEAGMLGHIVTLEAEAAGWRGTGIGCFFDDADHEVLGLKDEQFQVVYHYAVGMALEDARISTLPAYA